MVKSGSFEYIDQEIRKGSANELGNSFERLCKYYLENAPKYRGEFKQVWHWKDWPKRWGPDTGIDLIAETMDGNIWAIQAKGINPERSIPKSELDSFLSESNRPEIKFRLIIATTDDIGANARRTLAGQLIPVGLVLRGDLLGEELRWPVHLGEEPSPNPKKSPRPHQEEAIKNVLNSFKKLDRGKLILACGTGKTLTSLWIHENLKSKRTLFLVPSLSLINQTLLEWSANAKHHFDRIVVCSDDTVTQSGEDHAITSTADLGIVVTTNTKDIVLFLNKKHLKPVIVFCTYQSSDRITEAQNLGAPAFDLAIADEAHRTTGSVESNFAAVLDDSKIKSKKRLFMTATPHYFTDRVLEKSKELEYEMASMDDEKKYGPVFHQLTFGEAIKKNLLSDYQLVIISANEKERKMAEEAVLVRTSEGLLTDARTFAAQIGLAKAIKKYDLHKIITFHSSVAKAKRFADTEVLDSLPSVIKKLPTNSKPSGEIWASHISGLTPTGKRKSLLNQFAAFPNTTRAIITNCACLGEGVDVPTLDGVAFIDPKRSQIDIIQAVGRVIRKAPGIGIGTIVIPVFIDESEDEETVLTSSVFKPVWQVIRALRAHDEVLAEELDQLRLKLGKRSPYVGKVKLPGAIKLDIPTIVFKDFERAFNVRTVQATTSRPNLTVVQILAWADEHHTRTGEWPTPRSNEVYNIPTENWGAINTALAQGLRGFPGEMTLANILYKNRNVRSPQHSPDLSINEILKWADEYRRYNGKWPIESSGIIQNSDGENWNAISMSLRVGTRGFLGGSSLAKLLGEKRGAKVKNRPSNISINQILKWADEHHKRTGKWPTPNSGNIHNTKGETWYNIQAALAQGLRGLTTGLSLAKLLAEKRGRRNIGGLRLLTIQQILGLADEHHKRTGEWPSTNSGDIKNFYGEKWRNIAYALTIGSRGLSGGSSLAKLLSERRGVQNIKELKPLTIQQILKWADDHNKRTGAWPVVKSGPVHGDSYEKWVNINYTLTVGNRGLPGGSSLAKLLQEKRNVRNMMDLSPLTIDEILKWADKHYNKTGTWPRAGTSEIIVDAPEENWRTIDSALLVGGRGLPNGSSIARLLHEKRGVRNRGDLPPLTNSQILKWADEHYKRTGKWPVVKSGLVYGALGEKWANIDTSLSKGQRGLQGGSSLAKLLANLKGI